MAVPVSRYPSAMWKPIANRSSKALQKDLLSLHTMVSTSLDGTWSYFNTGAGGRGPAGYDADGV